MTDLDSLWQAYYKTKDQSIKERLVLEYAPLVKHVASRLCVHIGQHVEFDDLTSYGVFGLLDAIDKFDIHKGVKFETYASLRIRGEIIDNIRKMDWVPRTLRQRNKTIESLYTQLEARLGRQPTDEEMAEQLQVSIPEFHEMIKKSNISSLISLDGYMEQNHDVKGNEISSSKDSPEKSYDRKEVKQLLTNAINKLSEKEKKVITFYYYEGLTVREISKLMGVSESRISQIHSKAVMKLQLKLGKFKYILFE